jgi:hypothetical protein
VDDIQELTFLARKFRCLFDCFAQLETFLIAHLKEIKFKAALSHNGNLRDP